MRKYRLDPKTAYKHKARDKTGKLIKSKKLIKQPCENCGSKKNIEAHHLDYANPLKIKWLCSVCHRAEHKKQAEEV